ncbi:MAG: sigma-70 family RNA polymerase sigma factor [Myxococcales bacterium]|nr:sigma-70 family RNA polymerase sigma factor [Myxococcales bacterium]
MTTTELTVARGADARSRLLGELAAGPARRGYAVAYDLLGNRAEAEEAVQEALTRACENIGDLRDHAAAPAWFLRIVTTMCLRTLRRRRLRRSLFGWLDRKDGGTAAPTQDHIADGGAGDLAPLVHATDAVREPGDALADRERVHALLGSLDGLPAKQRAALVLRYGHDLSVPEVAQMLGVELATAKTHLVRGLARLRDLMEEHR